MSKITDHANTPRWLYNNFINDGYWDPCPNVPAFNGLEIPWHTKNYVNPPYSTKIPWIKKAIKEQKHTIMLLPVDTSSQWYHNLIIPFFKIFFIKSRLQLDNGHHPRYPSMLITLNTTNSRLESSKGG